MFHLASKKTTSSFVKNLNRLVCLTFVTGLLVLNALPSSVWAQTAYKGTFKLTKACRATTSISGQNPVALTVEKTYEVIGLNKETNPTYAYIKFPGFGQRWVDLTCGELSTAQISTDDTTASNPPNKSKSKFLPFFDNVNNPINVAFGGKQDLTPPAPQLNEFDKAVNQLCGNVGTVVSPVQFQQTLKKFPNVLANIKQNVGRSLIAGRTSDIEFLKDLTDIWFKAKGFDHIFCGEPEANKIGGLHFFGRYLDLQNRGLAGRLPNSDNKAEVIPGAVYSFGVVMQNGNRQVKSPIKGYGYTLNAEEILTIAVKAYKDNPNAGAQSQACLLNITDDGKTFANVFVAKNSGIRTFYPDATPDVNGTKKCQE